MPVNGSFDPNADASVGRPESRPTDGALGRWVAPPTTAVQLVWLWSRRSWMNPATTSTAITAAAMKAAMAAMPAIWPTVDQA